jgi:hypothetical protein
VADGILARTRFNLTPLLIALYELYYCLGWLLGSSSIISFESGRLHHFGSGMWSTTLA